MPLANDREKEEVFIVWISSCAISRRIAITRVCTEMIEKIQGYFKGFQGSDFKISRPGKTVKSNEMNKCQSAAISIFEFYLIKLNRDN